MENNEGFVLKHMDRITFGTNSIFLFMMKSNGEDIYQYEWEDAQKELEKGIEDINEKQRIEDEIKKKHDLEILKNEMEQKFNKEKQEVEEKMKIQLFEYEEKMKEMKESVEQSKLENSRKKVEIELLEKLKNLDIERSNKKREIEMKEKMLLVKKEIEKEMDSLNDNQNFEKILRNTVRKLNKMKIICSEFKRNINLEISIMKEPFDENSSSFSYQTTKIMVRVENYEEGTVYYWNTETFYNRYDMMKELFQRFEEEEEIDLMVKIT